MAADFQQTLDRLTLLRQAHIEVGREMLEAGPGIYVFDIFTAATLNRSMCLLKGFCALIEDMNYIAAAPLVRVQLDTYLRHYAARLVLDIDEFAMRVWKGVPVRRQKDRDGNLMTDRHLVTKAAKDQPWIEDLYEYASGYVHLSDRHYANAITDLNEDDRIGIKISDDDRFVPEQAYEELAQAFAEVTSLLLDSIAHWALQKRGYAEDKSSTEASGLQTRPQ